jgi:TIR domain/Sel1 repeat
MMHSLSSNDTLSIEAKLNQLSLELQQIKIQKQLEDFFNLTKEMIKKQAEIYLPKSLSTTELREILQPQVFISYAWEPRGSDRLKQLHIFLSQFAKDLNRTGIRTWLDLSCMTGNMDEKMRKGIKQSKYIIIIGTQCYGDRTADSKTNARKELDFALAETGKDDDFMLPLLFEKDFDSVFPGIKNFLIRDCRQWISFEQDFQLSWHDYITDLTKLSSPVGILPCLLGFTLTDYPEYRQACLTEYTILQRLLNLELGKIISEGETKIYLPEKISPSVIPKEKKYDSPIDDKKIEIVINLPEASSPITEDTSLQEIKIIPNIPPPLPQQNQAEIYCRKGQEYEEKEDYEAACQQYQLAADLKYPSAVTCLGYFALKGLCKPIDEKLAYRLFLEAARLGHPRAMKNLARMLVYGIGVDENPNQAIFWYQKNGSPKSREKAQKLIEQLGDKTSSFG